MIKKKNCIPALAFVLLWFSYSNVFSQEEKKDKYGRDLQELTLKKRGPNLDRYGHLYFGYGFIIGEAENDSAATRPIKSSSFNLGWLWKWRVNRWYELGFDASYHYTAFHLKQDSIKIVPNKLIHKREKLVFNNIQLIPFQRFKIRNRYHSTGTFIDLGGYFGWNYRVKHQTVENNRAPGAGKTRSVNLDLQYTEDFSYGVITRLGFNRFVFYGRYRFSDLFLEEENLPELPRFEVGLTIGIHQ